MDDVYTYYTMVNETRLKGHIGVNGTGTRSLTILQPLDRLTEVNAVLV
jgi:hypothetical protein